jgi:arylsulfatase A-like enzyme
VLVACEPGDDGTPGSVGAAPAPGFVLLSLDTLRADRLGCYGNERALTPTLDAVCAEGTRYTRAVANSPWTLPSHVSMLTGRYPRNHGVKNVGKQIGSDVPVLPEVLARAGYATMAITGSPKLGRRYGLERGFHSGVEHPPAAGRAAPLQIEQATSWMRARRRAGEPFFLFLHNFDVHTDYDPAPALREAFVEPYSGAQHGTGRELLALRNAGTPLEPDDVRFLSQLYDAGIRELDADLAPLFAFLRTPEMAAGTIVFVTSDHGEEFWEHGSVLHGVTMYGETLRIPLIAWGDGVPAGGRADELVQLSDLMPTILELAGIDAPPGIDGVSLVPTWHGGSLGRRHAFAEADWRGEQLDTFRMVRDEDTKLIYDRISGRVELYDLADDPDELHDLAADRPDEVERLMAPLRSYLGSEQVAPDRPPLSDEEIETLRALGYVE